MENGLIGLQEKRELSKIICQEYNRIIDNFQQEIKFTQGELLEEARNKFGVKIIEQKIEQLTEQIKLLQKKLKEIGFDQSYGNINGFVSSTDNKGNVEVDPTTKAGRFYYMKIARHADIQALHKQRDEKLKSLWLEDSRNEVKKIATSAIEIKMLEFTK